MDIRLRNSILQTLAYFDLFSHPLTKEEIHRWLWGYHGSINYADFLIQLEQLEHSPQLQYLEHKDGYYFLPGREEIVAERQRRVRLVEEKMRIAARGIKKLRWMPFVRAVFVCNTLSLGSVTKDSDIDVLLVTGKGRIWLVRLLSNAALKLFRMRTGKRGNKNKLCLSFFVAEDSLNLADLRIGGPDVYLIYWLSQLAPVYDPDNIRGEIMRQNAQNAWAGNFAPNAFGSYEMLSKYRVEDAGLSRIFKKVWEKMWGAAYGDFLESRAKGAQMAKFKMRGLAAKEDKSVVINDEVIKLHENDRRAEYQERWQRTFVENSKNIL